MEKTAFVIQIILIYLEEHVFSNSVFKGLYSALLLKYSHLSIVTSSDIVFILTPFSDRMQCEKKVFN